MEKENTIGDVIEDVVDLPKNDLGETLENPTDKPGESVQPIEPEKPVQTPSENAAFAAMRRRTEQLEKELAEREEILGAFFEGEEDPLIAAKAYVQEKTPEEVRDELLQQQDLAEKDRELEELRAFKAQNTFEKDLSEIKKVYPDLKAKSIEDLGDRFVKIMASSNLDPVTAYEIIKAQEERNKITPPPEVGKVSQHSAANKEYFTREEVKNMKQEDVHKNWEKIQKSREKWQ